MYVSRDALGGVGPLGGGREQERADTPMRTLKPSGQWSSLIAQGLWLM